MEDFKQYLSDNADDQERAAAEQIRAGLTGLRIEAKVAAVAAERQVWLRQRFWRRVAVLATFILLVGAAFLFFRKKEWPAQQPPPNRMEQPTAPGNQPEIIPGTPPPAPVESKKNTPIAGNRLPRDRSAPSYPAPNIRGESSGDSAWQIQLNRIWDTDYPPVGLIVSDTFAKPDQLLRARDFTNAYVQLQRLERTLPANDTLRFLKGYCLLEMGEGADARAYLENLERRQPDWAMPLQWYRGLSLLLTGDQEKALAAFQQIAANPRHTYHQQSKRAIQLLE